MTTVTITRSCFVGGRHVAAGERVQVNDADLKGLKAAGKIAPETEPAGEEPIAGNVREVTVIKGCFVQGKYAKPGDVVTVGDRAYRSLRVAGKIAPDVEPARPMLAEPAEKGEAKGIPTKKAARKRAAKRGRKAEG